MPSTTIGIDLSAQAKKTAACVIKWEDPSARIAHIALGADNQLLVELIAAHAPDKVAIDAPFGWPAPFISALNDSRTQVNGRQEVSVDRFFSGQPISQ
jgi:hypothetical protein